MELVIQLYLYNPANEVDPMRRLLKLIRQKEIDECFLRNLHHPLVKRFHILCENPETKVYYEQIAQQFNQSMKCVFVLYGKQPKYSDFLHYISETISNKTIVCIQNSDIYIDYKLSQTFLEETVKEDTLISLTRHEYTDESHSKCDEETCPLIWNYQGSHDTFLFRTPVPASFPYESVMIPQNVYGAEAVFMKAWRDTGKVIKNPCFDISIFHRHMHRITLDTYPVVADGYLCHANPTAPIDRPDIANSLKTIFTD